MSDSMSDSNNSSESSNVQTSVGQDNILLLPKEKKYIMVTDEETGKIKGCYPLKSKNLGTGWVAVYQNMISNLADEKLSYEEYRVFLKLLGKVDFDNYLTISQSEMANELDMRQSNVSRAIKGLCKRHVIVEGPRAGLNKTYRFNPYIAHKGANTEKTVKDFKEALKNHEYN